MIHVSRELVSTTSALQGPRRQQLRARIHLTCSHHLSLTPLLYPSKRNLSIIANLAMLQFRCILKIRQLLRLLQAHRQILRQDLQMQLLTTLLLLNIHLQFLPLTTKVRSQFSPGHPNHLVSSMPMIPARSTPNHPLGSVLQGDSPYIPRIHLLSHGT